MKSVQTEGWSCSEVGHQLRDGLRQTITHRYYVVTI